jgi:hypothetical protein
MTFTFRDVGTVSSRTTTPEGFLSVVADFARPGVQPYYAAELDKTKLPAEFQGDPYRQIKVLRPETEVFDSASMSSFGRKPVTNNHPPEFVDSKNYRDYQVGMSDGSVEQQNKRLRVAMTLLDAQAIQAVQDGKDQVSAGYDAELVWEPGVDPVHGAYDAKQTKIRGNHIAIVDKARGGSSIRINDSWPEATQQQQGDDPPMATEKVVEREINGITVAFSDQGAQAVDHVIKRLGEVEGQVTELKAKLTDSQKAQDKLQGELDTERKSKLTDAQIDDMITKRMAVVDQAKELFKDLDPKGKSVAEIKSETVKHVDSEFDLTGKSEDYVSAVFDTMYRKRDKTQTRDSMTKATENLGNQNPDKDTGSWYDGVAADAKKAYLKRSREAWKGGQA